MVKHGETVDSVTCNANTKDWNTLQVLATLKALPFGLRFRVASHSKQTCATFWQCQETFAHLFLGSLSSWLRQVWHRGLSEVEHGLNVQLTLLAYFVLCSHKSGLHMPFWPHTNTHTYPRGNIFLPSFASSPRLTSASSLTSFEMAALTKAVGS